MDRYDGPVDLPWGWWLRANGGVLEDPDGGRWNNVREAFWRGRLGFPADDLADGQHELLLRVLGSIASPAQLGVERLYDLFEGNMIFSRFFQSWLVSVGLVLGNGRNPGFDHPLTPEGRAVLLMLQATREPEWQPLPWGEVLDALHSADGDPVGDARERALSAFEAAVGPRRHLFARERVGRSHRVTLTSIGTEGRMPLRRVTWSLPFTDSPGRDQFFAWLARRVHRWDDWGGLAYHRGAEALTRHLFPLVFETGGMQS